jgi:hypothetical protein
MHKSYPWVIKNGGSGTDWYVKVIKGSDEYEYTNQIRHACHFSSREQCIERIAKMKPGYTSGFIILDPDEVLVATIMEL